MPLAVMQVEVSGSALVESLDTQLGGAGWRQAGPAPLVRDEGTAVVSAAAEFNFVGAGVTVSANGSQAIVTIPAGSGVTSVFGRTGAVVAVTGDYAPAHVGAVSVSALGQVSGVATLGADGKVPTAQLPPLLTATVYDSYSFSNITFTDQPSAETEPSSLGVRGIFNLVNAQRMRASGKVATPTGASGSQLYVQYSSDLTGTGAWTTVSGVGFSLATAGQANSSWVTVPASAKLAEVLLRFVGNGGDGVADPVIRSPSIYIESQAQAAGDFGFMTTAEMSANGTINASFVYAAGDTTALVLPTAATGRHGVHVHNGKATDVITITAPETIESFVSGYTLAAGATVVFRRRGASSAWYVH